MEIKLEPVYNQNDIKPRLTNNATPLSAFKPIVNQDSRYKFKLEDSENSSVSSQEFCSSSSSSTSSSSSSSGIGSNNPFYIDKIFNFQNMYLFPGSSTPHVQNIPNHQPNFGQQIPNIYNPLMLNDLHNFMQQNLIQNFYPNFNNSVLNQVKDQTDLKPKNNFSIERILSLPSDLKNVKKNSDIIQSNNSQPIFYPKFNRFNNTPIAITAPIPASVASMLNKPQNKPVGSIRGYKIESNSEMNKDTVPPKSNKNAKKYKCDLCGRGFSRSNTLITHRRIHTGEKPFECNVCGRAFRQPGNLTRHKLTHTTIKPYSCNKCGKSFNRVSNLHAHIKIHSDGKPYVCIVCGCSFYQKVDLKLHALSHSSDKIHECSFCKRTFKQAAHLKYHLHSHLKQFDKFDDELKQMELKKQDAQNEKNLNMDKNLEESDKKTEKEYEDHEEEEDIEDEEMVEDYEDEEELNEDYDESEEDYNEIEVENISHDEENNRDTESNHDNTEQNNSNNSN
ncbi:unnamed protein product [Brachionus calyciflorus]|uniref:C2H2-type domain-containing protein n=1 Tax=Brachionus calyciflorus TaxID=104777 RepID=A0A813UDE5_9BILA|nr:unnamed protein product [Brachionus calyciflorus]